MTRLTYRIVPHDGGWAYRVGDSYSEPFRNKDAALAAARRVVAEQRVPTDATTIEWEDASGHWHTERSDPLDRPEADVQG